MLLYRFQDHKINFIKEKNPQNTTFYIRCPKKIQILEKFLDKNLTKNFIRTSSSPTTSLILFVRKPGRNISFGVNYKTFNAITIKNIFIAVYSKRFKPFNKNQIFHQIKYRRCFQ